MFDPFLRSSSENPIKSMKDQKKYEKWKIALEFILGWTVLEIGVFPCIFLDFFSD